MKAIHADLKTAQEALSATPFHNLTINSVDYASRLISYEWVEEPYRDRATIVLDNHDRALDPGTVAQGKIDLRGKSFTIGTGYVTGSGNRYNGDGAGSDGNPTLWVKSQLATSLEGESVCILACEGMWMKLREILYIAVGDAPYYQYEYGGTQTIKTIIGLALAQATMTLNASYGDDGIVNSFMPFLTTNLPSLESLATLIYNLIRMTKTYLRPEASLVHKIIYPQITDSVNETYYSDQIPYFKEYTEKYNLLIPNDIKVYWGYNKDTGEWSAAALADPGSAVDQTSIDAYTTIREIFLAPDIENVTDANNRAAAILARYKAETLAGRLVLPYHDCSVELYDKVQVIDKRGL